MFADAQHNFRRGLVVSDLHLFAQRSRGAICLNRIRNELPQADVLVLNGDTFDFRWSTLASHEASQSAAIGQLQALLDDFPQCQIHFVAGNHDCLTSFEDRLSTLAKMKPRFQWHSDWLRLDSVLFLHGDCAHEPMDGLGLHRYREPWRNDRQRGVMGAVAYRCSDRLGLTQLAHRWHFPRHRTLQRVAHYLDKACPDWRGQILDCYFGHTHLPFSNHEWNGIRFHNTGSAIREADFNPLTFALPVRGAAEAELERMVENHAC